MTNSTLNNTQLNTDYKQIIQMAMPLMSGILISQINFFTNTYFLGHFGKNELAANGVASIFYMVLAMVCVGLSNGVQIILSRRAGEGNKPAMGAIFSNSIKIGILFTIVLMALSAIIAPVLFKTQLHDGALCQLATSFILIRIFGLPFFFLEQASNQFFISINKTKNILAGIIVATIVNIAFDYILINGHFGFAPMGIKGAAIASVLSEICYVLMAYSIIFFKKYNLDFFIKLNGRIDWPLTKDTFNIAAPVIMQYFFSIATWELFYIYIEHLGKNELAISQILRSVFGLVGASSWALASSTNTLVSNLLGQQKPEAVIPAIKKVVTLSFPIALLLGSILLFFPTQFMGVYTSDSVLIKASLWPIVIVVLSNMLLSISTVIFNGVLGTGSTKINMGIEFCAIIIYIIYIYFVIEKYRMSLAWAWGSEFIYWTTILILAISYLKWGAWRDRKV
jgi:multidrug resistance protein, MATE family